MTIPEKAVEAAAKAYYALGYGASFDPTWNEMLGAPKYETDVGIVRATARQILEAAAPYMQREAWDEGFEAACDRDIRVNPYMSQQ